MLKRVFHILFVLALVFTTTASIWKHLIADQDDAIELSSETELDGEKSEKESKKESEEWNNDLHFSTASILPELFCGFQKAGSSSFVLISKHSQKLYLLFSRFKLDC